MTIQIRVLKICNGGFKEAYRNTIESNDVLSEPFTTLLNAFSMLYPKHVVEFSCILK